MSADEYSRAADLQNVPGSADESAPLNAEELRKELAAQKEKYLRLAADFDNFQKRTRRDSEQQAAAAKEAFIRDLLPVLDDLERVLVREPALSSGQEQGTAMILQQLGQLLRRHGIEAVEDLGRPFDPERHEAVSVQYDPGRPHHSILEVIQRGYVRGDTVFRPAKVVVNSRDRQVPGAGYGC